MRLLNWILQNNQKKISQAPSSESTGESRTEETITEETIREVFRGCGDVTVQGMSFDKSDGLKETVLFFFSQGLVDTQLIDDEVVPRLDTFFRSAEDYHKERLIEDLRLSSTEEIIKRKDLSLKVFRGSLVLYFVTAQLTLSVDISKIPGRDPEETNTEVSVLGPRDGFVENIKVNSALLRKRIPSESLKYEEYKVGERTNTSVGLMYMEDIINPDVLSDIKSRLANLKIDGLLNSNQLTEMLRQNKMSLLPSLEYTGRPDFTANALLRGRFLLLLDGSPIVLIGPVNIFLLLKSAEDSELIPLYSSFERLLRVVGLSLAIFLPGFWVAVTTYHQDQIPVLLLATLASARRGVPLPTAIEAFVMLGLFELFREAGARLPLAIGQTLTVVGGLIIGDAAIRAGLTNPGIIVIIATSLVATFTLVNQSMIGVFSLLRLLVVAVSSLLGLFGFLISAFFILYYVANIRSYGLPYLAPFSPVSSIRDVFDNIFRSSWRDKGFRPDFMNTKDNTRK
ncbi:spore germination protein [Salipaludibacillus aurantiacus]|uniref:GerA spore germination protein n=1 Tax=Salipaludibacillus aurantiacus TaxID=1601833 RepID=A0A1H9VQV0_9BACI|nr:spore germination protein [Salipaludibacillus aurantiacus]SES23972.1 GerA spore germination protein [Salipaludibacillus aurantiacus]